MRTRERASLWIAGAIGLAALLAIGWRVLHGIDFTDDSFYLALPLRFALGDRPFVEELNIAQTAGLFLVPFVKAYVALRGTRGLMLFVRVLFILFFAGVGWSAYALARTRLPRHAALLASVTCITFLPHGIPGLSYNTLGSGLLAIGLFVAARSLIAPRDAVPRLYADAFTWSGFALGAAAFAYPTLLGCAVVATVMTFAMASGRRFVAAGRMALGGGAFMLLVSPLLVTAGRRHLAEVLKYSASGLTASEGKLGRLTDECFQQHPEWAALLIATALAVALSRKWPRALALLVPLLPLLARGAVVQPFRVSIGYVTTLALVAPLAALALRDSRAARVLIAAVWVPSTCAGMAMAWTSSNGFLAAASGLFAAAIVSTIVVAMWVDELARRFHTAGVRVVFGFAPVVVLLIMTKLALAPESTYRDAPLPKLTTRVTGGPFAGLYTTPERERELAQMSEDILARVTTSRALFYYDFPAGYLIAARRPLAASPWIFFREPATTMDAESFSRLAIPGDVVFKMDAMNPAANALDRAVQERCRPPETARGGYSVWVVR